MGLKIKTSSLQKILPMRWDYMRGDGSDRLREDSSNSFEEDSSGSECDNGLDWFVEDGS